LLDRGCFHYLELEDRLGYVAEAWRVLRPGGRLLLRACLPHRPSVDAINEPLLHDLFSGWGIRSIARRLIPVDSGVLEALEARLER